MGLGILISSSATGAFRNRVVTFSNIPTFVELTGEDIHERYLTLRNSSWAGRMDFEATFELILARAKEKNVDQNNFPMKLLVISDMDFKEAGGTATNFSAIDARYKAAGYTRPLIVFWNICVDNGGFSVSSHSNGTTLISGFYRCIVHAMLAGSSPDPWSIARSALDDSRYAAIRSEIAVL